MKVIKNLLIVILITAHTACSLVEEGLFSRRKLEVQWSKDTGQENFRPTKPIVTANNIIYTYVEGDYSNGTSEIFALEKATGQKLWNKDVGFILLNRDVGSNLIAVENQLHVPFPEQITIDVETGQKGVYNNSNFPTNNYTGRLKKYGRKVITLFNQDSKRGDLFSDNSIQFYQGNSFEWEEILRRVETESNSYKFTDFTIDENILYLNYFSSSEEYSLDAFNLLKFDLNSNEVISDRVYEMDIHTLGVDFQPLANSEKFFVAIDGDLICIDNDTNEIDWRIDLQDKIYNARLSDDMNSLYFQTYFGLYKYDIDTGNEIWFEAIQDTNDLIYHNNYLYTESSGSIIALEANSGRKVVDFSPDRVNRNDKSDFYYYLKVDSENDLLYASSSTHIYCFKTFE